MIFCSILVIIKEKQFWEQPSPKYVLAVIYFWDAF